MSDVKKYAVLCKRVCGLLGLVLWIAGGAGCAHTAPTRFYTLESRIAAPASADAAALRLNVLPVILPKYLGSDRIAVRKSGNELDYREFDRWAEPLRDGVPRALRDALARLLPAAAIEAFPQGGRSGPDLSIEVGISRFEASHDGVVCLDGTVVFIRAGEEIQRRPFAIATALAAPDAAAIAGAMSGALDRLAQEIVASAPPR